MAPLYRLVPTSQYQAEFDRIAAGTDTLALALEKGVYFSLVRDPQRGSLLSGTSLRIIRQRIVPDILLVQIYYRIDETNREVILVSIREVDLRTL